MNKHGQSYWIVRVITWVLVIILVNSSLLIQLPTVLAADSSPTPSGNTTICPSIGSLVNDAGSVTSQNPGDTPTTTAADSGGTEPDPGDYDTGDTTTINQSFLNGYSTINPNLESDLTAADPSLNIASGNATVCTSLLDQYLTPIPETSAEQRELSTFSNVESKITFTNPQDLWALTGEPCTKYLSNGTCDETVGSNGKPLYYQDIYWKNGHWDAPKVDARVLEALTYLVTPIAQGGAGHEHITVGKIVQNSEKDTDFIDANQTSSDQQEQEQDISANYYDETNPEHPAQLAQAMDITQIDNIRITTQITEHSYFGDLFGGNTVLYQYKSYPINVSWQSNQGASQAQQPNISNLYQGSLQSTTSAFGSLLSNLDLGTTINPSTTAINSLSGLTSYVGNTLLGKLFQGSAPQGNSLSANLDQTGRNYLATQLNLPNNSLTNGTTVDQVVQDLGEAIAENNLGLPSGSLAGSSSNQIFQNIGYRFFENILNVSAGTLSSSSIHDQDSLLVALGRGKIENQYQLTPGSLDKIQTNSQLINLNAKTQSEFNSQNANVVDDDLLLTYAPGPMSTALGLNNSNFIDSAGMGLTTQMIAGQISLATYELLVGVRTWDSTLGQLTTSSSSSEDSSQTISTDYAAACNGATDASADASSCLSNIVGDTFIPYFLQDLGVNLTAIYQKTIAAKNALESGSRILTQLVPSQNTTIAQALGSSEAQQLVSSGAFTQADLNTLVSGLVNTLYSDLDSYKTPTPEAIIAEAPNELQTSGYFKEILDQALIPLTAQLNQAATDSSYLPPAAVTNSDTLLTNAESMIDSDTNQWVDVIAENDQSGASAALDLPSQLPNFDQNGNPTSGLFISEDPVAALAKGDMSQMEAIGKLELAQKMTSGDSAQYVLASNLQNDLSASYGESQNNPLALANTGALTGSGLQSEDFKKIFEQNLAPQVFERVGKTALLNAAWNITDVSSTLTSATSSAPALGNQISALPIASSASSDFYQTNWQKLGQLLKEIVTDNKQSQTTLVSQLASLSTITPPSTQSYIDQSSNVEVLLSQLSNQNTSSINLIQQADSIINEIIAGENLSFNQPADPSTTTQQGSSCWSQSDLRQALENGDNLFSTYTIKVGACQTDTALNLPSGSISDFYNASQASQAGLPTLEASIGQADYGTTQYPTESQAITRGLQDLTQQATNTILSLVPGASSVGISAQTIYNLVEGITGPISISLGGNALDNELQLPQGTMSAAVQSTCQGTCTVQQYQNSQTQALAIAGMSNLGAQLGLPASFDITSSGDFTDNLGKSFLSETLGLATNSFGGSFSQLLGSNNQNSILNAFGITLPQSDQQLSSLSSNATTAANNTGDPSLQASFQQIATSAQNQLTQDENTLISQMENGSSILYTTNPNSNQLSSWYNSFTNSDQSILNKEAGAFGSQSTIMSLLEPYLTNTPTTSGGTNSNSTTAAATSIVSGFQQQISQLNANFQVGAGTFSQFLQGMVSGDSIDEKVGLQQAVTKLSSSAINQLLNSTNDPYLAKTISSFASAAGCSSGTSLADVVDGASSSCSLKGINLSDIFSGTSSADQKSRSILYSSLLVPAFGNILEKQMDVPAGTVRAMASNPRQAPEIALSTGLTIVADQLFQTSSKSTAFQNSAELSLRQAFLAGFYNPTTNKYQFDFNTNRALSGLNQTLVNMEQTEVGALTKKALGVSITLSDLQSIASGDTDGLLYIGMERLAQSNNQTIQDIANAASFYMTYDEIRDSTEFGAPTTQEFINSFEQGAITQLETNYENKLLDCTSGDAAFCTALEQAINNPSNTTSATCLINSVLGSSSSSSCPSYTGSNKNSILSSIVSAANASEINFDSNRKSSAQQNLQYDIYNIAAFKLDPSIPPNFARVMLQGNSAEQGEMLAQLALNTLHINISQIQTDATIIAFLATGNYSDLSTQDEATVVNFATNQINKAFGVNLDPTMVAGALAWASTGFDPSQFDAKSITISNAFSGVASVGQVLSTDLDNKLFQMGDTAFGLPSGSTYQIYTAYRTYASKPDTANGADLVAQVATAVFAKQLNQFGAQLGLPPGVVPLAARMLIDAFFGIPPSPQEILQLVQMVLFGVYKTTEKSLATADGYYPYKGSFGASGLADPKNPTTTQAPSPDYPIGEFNPNNTTSYQNGIEAAAQAKVQSVLQDLLLFPAQWGAAQGIDPNKLYISQVYTLRQEDLVDLDYLISAPSPRDNPPGLGYGPLSERTTAVSYNSSTKTWTDSPSGTRFGYFYSPLFWNEIHVRW